MDSRIPGAVLEPPEVPTERLFRVPRAVYDGLLAHGLLAEGEGVRFLDGLLVNGSDRLYRMPLAVYERVAELGLLGPRDRVELLDGLLVTKMPKGPPHMTATMLTLKALEAVLPAGWHARVEGPVALPGGPGGHDGEPEPDVTVVRGGIRDYAARHPRPGDTVLVVEVAESSIREDRKGLERFARKDIPVAWIVNLVDETVEVYSRPIGPTETEPARYGDVATYARDESVPVVVDGREVGRIPVPALLL
jgi:Uma2 family endonuclease